MAECDQADLVESEEIVAKVEVSTRRVRLFSRHEGWPVFSAIFGGSCVVQFKGTLSRVDMRRNFHSRGLLRTRVFVGRHYGIVGKCIKFAFILHLNQIYV